MKSPGVLHTQAHFELPVFTNTHQSIAGWMPLAIKLGDVALAIAGLEAVKEQGLEVRGGPSYICPSLSLLLCSMQRI